MYKFEMLTTETSCKDYSVLKKLETHVFKGP